MKQRFQDLHWFPKILLVAMAVMIPVFLVLYAITTNRVGYAWHDTILAKTEENGDTVYTGRLEGNIVCFTMTADKTVTLQYGDETYGPYTVRKDGSAIPRVNGGIQMTGVQGVEIRCKGEIVFRGAYQRGVGVTALWNEDGTYYYTYKHSDGTVTDEKGNLLDPREPTPETLIELAEGPEIVHKGSWWMWIAGVMMCMYGGVSILYAKEGFRFRMRFWVKYAEDVEPSDFRIVVRGIVWFAWDVAVLIIFIYGLKMII